MIAKIKPSKCKGSIKAPPSKSMAHRLLICAGLSQGQSTINNVDLSEDIAATLDCLSALGAKWKFDKQTIIINGVDIRKTTPDKELACRESGSTLRFFIPLALTSKHRIAFTGSEYLLNRPLDIYQEICKNNHLLFEKEDNQITVQGPLINSTYSIPGNISSQFVSGLLFALPLLDGGSTLHIQPPLESLSYIKLTLQALQVFGIKIIIKNKANDSPAESGITFLIKGGQNYKASKVNVEGDYSNAAFLEALNLFSGEVSVTGLEPNSLQGDRVYPDLFNLLKNGKPVISLKDCPDLGPILFTVAAAFNGGTFIDTKRLAIKESDRAKVMAKELAKFGIGMNVASNQVEVFSGSLNQPNQALYGHNDHRIVMSLAVLCSVTGGTIDGVEAVRKSYPKFFDDISQLGVKYDLIGVDHETN